MGISSTVEIRCSTNSTEERRRSLLYSFNDYVEIGSERDDTRTAATRAAALCDDDLNTTNLDVVLVIGPVLTDEANALAEELVDVLQENPTNACSVSNPRVSIFEGPNDDCDNAQMGYKNALRAWKDFKKTYRKLGVSNFKDLKSAKKNYKKCIKGKKNKNKIIKNKNKNVM